jgi:hypothetical protein
MPFNQDFATTTCDPPKLLEELGNDPLPITTAIDAIQYHPSTDLTRIIWNTTPSGAEQTAASNVVAAHSMTGEDQFQLVEATADTTTGSATDVTVDSMIITPMAGTYKVTFVGSVDHNTSNATIYLSIYGAGAKVAGSERVFKRGGGQGNITAPFTCRAKVTVDGTETIEGCWRTDAATATMHQRQLSIERVD